MSFASKISMHAEIHGESDDAYRMKLKRLELKILMNIQLGVICTDVAAFHRPGHIAKKLAISYSCTCRSNFTSRGRLLRNNYKRKEKSIVEILIVHWRNRMLESH